MYKFIVVCALLTTACAVRRGFGHSRVSYTHADTKPVYTSSEDDHAVVLLGASDKRSDAFHYHLGNSGGGSRMSSDAHAEVLSAGSHIRPDGFDYHLETTNGVSSKASGDEAGRIHGNFQWVSPEGEHIKLSYVADENGYHPDSAILPTPPPIPEAILKSLKYNENHPYQEEADDHYEHHHPHHEYHPHQHPHHEHQQYQVHYNNRRF